MLGAFAFVIIGQCQLSELSLGIIGMAKIILNFLILIFIFFQAPKSSQFLLNFVVTTEV